MKASIVIPTYNSSERLMNNLISLNYQNCSAHDFEVIIVDNKSKDDTLTKLSKFRTNFKMLVIPLPKNMGRSYARNQGIMNSKGNIIIFHDSDMIAEKDFVRKHLDAHCNNNIIVCGCSWKRIYSFHYKNFNGYVKDRYINLRKGLYPKKTLMV